MRFSMILLLAAVAASAGLASAADVRREIQFPDLPNARTLKCDLHMHTVFSDGLVWPTVRVKEAWKQGLDAIAITDHIEYLPHKADINIKFNRPYELVEDTAKLMNILLVRGVEITRDTPPGHFNAIFLKDNALLDTKDFYEVFDRAAQQQAFITWNHPGWQGLERGKWGEAQTRLFERKQLHAIEICNGDEFYPEAFPWAVERNLAVLGCSDEHEPFRNEIMTPENHRTLTLVFARERTLDGLREAMFAGQTAAWWKNQLFGREQELAPLFAASVEISPVRKRTTDSLWVEVKNRCEIDIRLECDHKDKPRLIVLPARATSLVVFPAPATGDPEPVNCRVTNFLVGPNKSLNVRLEIPRS
ncbi:MAG: histidinol-phosphatase [Phycisphaerae bacterium]|nr:histidinol-phosphatase [Phycisphaerae bacterium]